MGFLPVMPAGTPQRQADDCDLDWQTTNPTPTTSASTDSDRKVIRPGYSQRISTAPRGAALRSEPIFQKCSPKTPTGNEPATCRSAGAAAMGLMDTAAVGRKGNAVLPATSPGLRFIAQASAINEYSSLNPKHNRPNGGCQHFSAAVPTRAAPKPRFTCGPLATT